MSGISAFVGLKVGYGARAWLRKAVFVASLVFFVRPAIAETVILAFGDSLTAGFGLAEEDGFARQLEGWLRAQGADIRVVNAGVSGDTTAGGLARIDWSLSEDIDAVIVELGGNDLLRALPPVEAQANLDAILAAISARDMPILLAGLPGPPNLGADYKREFDAIFPALSTKYAAILYPNFLKAVAKDKTFMEIAALFQPDGLHPNAVGVKAIVGDIGPYVLRLLAEVD